MSSRGFNLRFGTSLLVQIDGRTLYNPISAGVYWDTVDYPLARLVGFQKGRKVETAAQAQPGYGRYLGASGIQGLSDGYAATAYAVMAKQSDVLMPIAPTS